VGRAKLVEQPVADVAGKQHNPFRFWLREPFLLEALVLQRQ
jgi:hypothetical protein